MATTASIAAVPSVATAGVAAYAGISPHNTTSRADLSGEGETEPAPVLPVEGLVMDWPKYR